MNGWKGMMKEFLYVLKSISWKIWMKRFLMLAGALALVFGGCNYLNILSYFSSH